MPRPTSVTIIGWVWIGVGILLTLSGSLHVAMARVALDWAEEPGGRADTDFPFEWLPATAAAAEILVATVAIVSAICFLRLRAWARTVLEILSWVMFAGLVCFGVGFSIYWAVGAGAFLEQMGWAFVMLGAGLSIAICAFFATPFVVMAKFLRSATVRNAVTCKGQTPVHQAGGKGSPGSQG